MLKKLFLLLMTFSPGNFLLCHGKDKRIEHKGWVVLYSTDVVFIPAEDEILPTYENFETCRKLTGYLLNGIEDAHKFLYIAQKRPYKVVPSITFQSDTSEVNLLIQPAQFSFIEDKSWDYEDPILHRYLISGAKEVFIAYHIIFAPLKPKIDFIYSNDKERLRDALKKRGHIPIGPPSGQ